MAHNADIPVALFAGALVGSVILSLAVAAVPDKRTLEDSKPRVAIEVEAFAVEFEGSNRDLDLANISDQIARIEKLLAKTVEKRSQSNHCPPVDIEAQQVGCVNFATSEYVLDQDAKQSVQEDEEQFGQGLGKPARSGVGRHLRAVGREPEPLQAAGPICGQ